MTRLTIVVPVRDGGKTLERCLTALVAALANGGDIVVVDDGSTDDTASIAARFPVRLVQLPTSRGASAARNAGIAATTSPIVGFVDSDVVLRPDALTRLLAHLDAAPHLLGVNGLLALDLSTPGVVSAFANTSIHYQHLTHGHHVASSFTSICLLRREALVQMGGGWEEDTSCYADDVATRWHLPDASIDLVPDAQAEHLKRVSLRGLLKHRFNVGYFFVGSLASHRKVLAERPRAALLGSRYPLNTAAAALSLAALPWVVLGPVGASTLLVPASLFIAANAGFARFTLHHRGSKEAFLAIPISALEGFAYLFGMGWSATTLVRNGHVRPSTAPRRVRPPLRQGGPGEQALHEEAPLPHRVRDGAVRAQLRALFLPGGAAQRERQGRDDARRVRSLHVEVPPVPQAHHHGR